MFSVSENRYCPLNRDEYIFDITTELANQKKEFYLLFQRTSWITPLHLDKNSLYVDVMYYQVRKVFLWRIRRHSQVFVLNPSLGLETLRFCMTNINLVRMLFSLFKEER